MIVLRIATFCKFFRIPNVWQKSFFRNLPIKKFSFFVRFLLDSLRKCLKQAFKSGLSKKDKKNANSFTVYGVSFFCECKKMLHNISKVNIQ